MDYFVDYSAMKSSRIQVCSFRPERVLFRPGGVNLRPSLRGVPMYAFGASILAALTASLI
jgi:hypothetical protein